MIVADDTVLLQGAPIPASQARGSGRRRAAASTPRRPPLSAAIREVYEETGLVVAARDVRGPVGTRVVAHGYSDRILLQHETFYLLRAERFDPVPAALTAREAERRVETRWFPLDALPVNTWPAELATIAAWDGGAMLASATSRSRPSWCTSRRLPLRESTARRRPNAELRGQTRFAAEMKKTNA